MAITMVMVNTVSIMVMESDTDMGMVMENIK